MSHDEAQQRREYLEERKLLIDWEHSATTGFDKAMLTLSSGALVLSLTYLKELGGPSAWGWALRACWVLFGFSVLSTSWSFLSSQCALRRERDIRDSQDATTENAGAQRPQNHCACLTGWLNLLSLIAFTLGVVSLAIYALSGSQGGESQ